MAMTFGRYTRTLLELLQTEREIASHPQRQPPKYLQQQAGELRERLLRQAALLDDQMPSRPRD